MNLRYNDRAVLVGSTGSGKSELLNLLAMQPRCQRLLLDTKQEFSVAGVKPARSVTEIDWRQPLVHYVDRTGEVAEFEELFAACFRRRHLVVICHELSDLCEYQAGRTPTSVNAYLSKGRAHGLGLLGGTQRPVNMPVRARTEVEHVFLFPPRLSPQDHDSVADITGRPRDELGAILDQVHAELGDYSYLYWSRQSRELTAHPPLTANERAGIRIHRLTVK